MKETKVRKVKEFMKQIRLDRLTEHWKTASKNDDDFAFVVDLDAQFIFVPKIWVRDILMQRIIKVSSALVQAPGFSKNSIILDADRYYKNQELIANLDYFEKSCLVNLLDEATNIRINGNYARGEFYAFNS